MHPELRENEFLISNVEKGKEWCFGFRNAETTLGFSRLGKVAYDRLGRVRPNYLPVFSINWWVLIVNGKMIRMIADEIHLEDIHLLTDDEIKAVIEWVANSK